MFQMCLFCCLLVWLLLMTIISVRLIASDVQLTAFIVSKIIIKGFYSNLIFLGILWCYIFQLPPALIPGFHLWKVFEILWLTLNVLYYCVLCYRRFFEFLKSIKTRIRRAAVIWDLNKLHDVVLIHSLVSLSSCDYWTAV